MKTIREIAEEAGQNKQRVYRYIKKHRISEAHQKGGVMYYDDVAVTAVIQGLTENERVSEAHRKHINEAVFDVLKAELETKNRQIEELHARLAETTAALVAAQQTAAAAQALHAGTIQQQLTGGEAAADERGGVEKRRGLFGIFRKKPPDA